MVTPWLARRALSSLILRRAWDRLRPLGVETGPLNGLEFVQHRLQRDLVGADERVGVRRAAQGVEQARGVGGDRRQVGAEHA